jgi:Na+-transporting NADH:ubiquinone oxidoreductase subunit C
LWGKIFGYLALKSDGSTVTGFTVYKHSETPGLGGEIEKRWFQKNFEGKKILDKAGGFVSISIAKGFLPESFPKDKLPNYVDGISGATLTGKFLTTGLKDVLQAYEQNITRHFPYHCYRRIPSPDRCWASVLHWQ